MEKISFSRPDEEPVEFYVLEQTRLGGINYLLVTDKEEGDAEALILKDLSSDDEIVTINKIDLITYDKPIKTYNLTVEGNGNYFVTYSKVLVHNSPA